MNTALSERDEYTLEYSKITDQIYLGSDLCSAEVCKLHGPEFAKLGITLELSLTAELKDTPTDSVAYCWIPIIDNEAPTKQQFDLGGQIINTIVEQGGRVYIHCRIGHGRSPTMLAGYFIKHKNMTPSEALDLIKKGRPEIHPNDLQIAALEKYHQHD